MHRSMAIPGDAASLSAMCNYTALFNVLDMPAGVLPVTRVTEADEKVPTRPPTHP